ncbi:MAG: hypothetical protein ACRYFS_21545 [Janthinobacterium lividum]
MLTLSMFFAPAFPLPRRAAIKSLLFCVALSCFVFTLPAHAQYSGSGWVAQPSPTLGTAQNPVWDWTGLTVLGNGSFLTLFDNNFYHSEPFTAFGPGGNSLYTVDITGTATYKWLWQPLYKGVLDLTDFPAPSLYVLARISASSTVSQSAVLHGVTGSGSVSDGWGSTLQYSTFPGTALIGTPPSWKLLPAPGSPAAATFSPSAHIKVVGGTIQQSFSPVISMNKDVFPIVLSTPNPLNRPDLGDGTNQFVYDATAPSATAPFGFLNFPDRLPLLAPPPQTPHGLCEGTPMAHKSL